MDHPVEFDVLAEHLFTFSQEVLERTGSFYPHGAFINQEGKPELFAVYSGEHPDREELYASILAAFKRDARTRGYRATGISADGRAAHPSGGPKRDAILVFLEAATGEAITVAMPYRVSPDGNYQYEPTFAFRKTPEVFSQ